jgi:hypothetical protein
MTKRLFGWFCSLVGAVPKSELEEAKSELEEAKSELEEEKRKRIRSDLSVYLTFLTTGRLAACSLQTTSDSSYEELARQYALQSIFGALVVKDMPAMPDNPRSQAPIQSIWGRGSFQRAHIIPLSRGCSSEWIDVFLPLIPEDGPGDWSLLASVLLFGFYTRLSSRNQPIRSNLSGLIHNAINFLGIPQQLENYDTDPAILMIPLLSMSEILTWSGTAYRCLIIARDAAILRETGFCGDEHTSSYSCEVDTQSAEVQEAFQTFSRYQRMMTVFLAAKDLANPNSSAKCRLSQAFREFLQLDSTRTIPCIDPSQLQQKCVVCLTFTGINVRFPGSTAPAGDGGGSLRTCPHPFPLILRSINAVYNMTHRLNLWPEWERWLAATHPDLAREALVLLPSCLDRCPHTSDCLYCKAASIAKDPHLFPDLSDRGHEAAAAFCYLRWDPSDEDADLILDAVPVYEDGGELGHDSEAVAAPCPPR